jgi:hypothetical protein
MFCREEIYRQCQIRIDAIIAIRFAMKKEKIPGAMSCTTLVNVDADTATKLIEFIGDISEDESFKTECRGLVEKSDGAGLVARLLSKEKAIFALGEDLDIEGCFMTIASVMLIYRNETDDVVQKFIDVLCSSKGKEDKVFLRLKLLVTVFNMVSVTSAKHTLICSTLNYAMNTQQESETKPFIERVDGWVKAWKLDPFKNQELTFLAYNVAKSISEKQDGIGNSSSSSGKADNNLKYLISYLNSFPKDSALPDSVVSTTVPLIVEALKGSASASFEQRSALLEGLQSSAVANAGEPLKSLLALLSIVCSGESDKFEEFTKSNASIFTEHGLDREEMANTMRLLALSTLACTKSKLTYSEISAALGIDNDSVEMVVVEAVGQGVIEATMDQFEESITVTKCTRLSVGKSEWVELSNRLKTLRANIGSVFKEIKQNKAKA